MTTTSIEEPDTGEIPSWVGESKDNQAETPKSPGNSSIDWKIWGIVAIVMIIAVLAITFFLNRNRGDEARETTRNTAEAVLRARFNDTSDSVGPLKSLKVEWQGDQLIATWTQGESAQKHCTAPVLVSEDGQNFGIAPFEAVPFDKQAAAPANCTVTAGLEYGFPLGPKP